MPWQYCRTVRTGATSSLLSAPVGRHLGYYAPSEAVWSSDTSKLLLTNTYLPLSTENGSNAQQRVRPCIADLWVTKTRENQCLLFSGEAIGDKNPANPAQLQEAVFNNDGSKVALRLRTQAGYELTLHFENSQGQWKQNDALTIEDRRMHHSPTHGAIAQGPEFAVQIHEDLNTPPTLQIVTNTAHTMPLWDPNPQFAVRSWGTATVFHWKDQAGYEWTGGLVKPLNYIPGKRYPLVIQMYQFRNGEFITDGMAPTAMPARALASAGIVYLQASRKPKHTWDQGEAQDHLNGTLSAIVNEAVPTTYPTSDNSRRN